MPALLDRPKMSRAMWDALKSHIMRERQRKKQEQEADEAIERQKRERENKQKQDVMTLEETKEQIAQAEQKLIQLREEKHQLFVQLKKVLNEDETRRQALIKENNDAMGMSHHGYTSTPIQLGGHPALFMQGGMVPTRASMYNLGIPPPKAMIIPHGLKRARSPSPPPVTYQQPYNYKAQAAAAYTQRLLAMQNHCVDNSPTWKNPRVSEPSPYPGGPGGAYYAQPHSSAPVTFSTAGQAPAYSYTAHGPYPPAAPAPQPAPNPESASVKLAQQHAYHIQHIPQGAFPQQLHPSLEHGNPKTSFPDEKYFNVQQLPAGVQLRGVAPLHGAQSVIPIQQQSKPGGISAGYPIRGQPSQSVAGYQPPSSTPQHVQNVVYTSQQNAPRHTYPGAPQSRYY